MSIIDEIKNGENKKIEFKSIMPSGTKIMKTAIAFSNCAGGKLIIGIEDDGTICGVTDEDIFEIPDKISNIIYDSCYPMILPEMYTEAIGNKNIFVIEFYPGNLKPYYIKAKGKLNGTYVRVGATNKLADENMIFDLERQKRNISFDEEINYDFEVKSKLLKELKKEISKPIGRKIEVNDLINLKIIKKENGSSYITNGGLLLSGVIEDIDFSIIKCARFKGDTTVEFIDSKEFNGALYKQVESAMNFIKTYIEKSAKIIELKREEEYSIPLVAIREALINAVVHRDYNIKEPIKVAIFDNRIEIISPGSLPKSLDINDLKLGRSEVRNRIIARFFKEIGYIEQWGTGIRRIINLCEKISLKEPFFNEVGNGFKVTIYKEKRDDKIENADKSAGKSDNNNKNADKSADNDKNADKSADNDKNADKSNLKQKIYDKRTSKIMVYLKENKVITTKIAMDIINLKDTATKKLLKEMVSDGLIEAVGEGKARKYLLVSKE